MKRFIKNFFTGFSAVFSLDLKELKRIVRGKKMTTDSGKNPQEIWMLVLDNGDRILRDFKPLQEDTFVHGITNERHHVVSKHHMVEPTPCPNCERLEDQLYHESRKAPEIEYKLGHEIEVLKKQLEMFTEDNIREVILEWKHDWMNQTQNSKEDYENYHRRAFGVDANMQYSLAKRIAAMAKLESENKTTENVLK